MLSFIPWTLKSFRLSLGFGDKVIYRVRANEHEFSKGREQIHSCSTQSNIVQAHHQWLKQWKCAQGNHGNCEMISAGSQGLFQFWLCLFASQEGATQSIPKFTHLLNELDNTVLAQKAYCRVMRKRKVLCTCECPLRGCPLGCA